MANGLRLRLLGGDLSALTDPALELDLLAAPGADWWRTSVGVCLRTVYQRLTRGLATSKIPAPPPGADQNTGAYLLALLDLAAPMPDVADALRVLLHHGAAYVEGAVPDVDDAREADVLRRMLVAQGFDGVAVRVRRLGGDIEFCGVWCGHKLGSRMSLTMWNDDLVGHRDIVRDMSGRFARFFRQAKGEAVGTTMDEVHKRTGVDVKW